MQMKDADKMAGLLNNSEYTTPHLVKIKKAREEMRAKSEAIAVANGWKYVRDEMPEEFGRLYLVVVEEKKTGIKDVVLCKAIFLNGRTYFRPKNREVRLYDVRFPLMWHEIPKYYAEVDE